MVRHVADRSSEQDRERAASDGIDSLLRTVSGKPPVKPPFKKVVSCLRERSLTLLQADKEGGFVLMPDDLFGRKAMAAVEKNFKSTIFVPKEQKKEVVTKLTEYRLESLRKSVEKAENGFLRVFFTGKTHKPECPLRVIVSERNSWQHLVSCYLQRHLKNLTGGDPFLVQSSADLVEDFGSGELKCATTAFSLDIEDLFYSIPHDDLFIAVRERIEVCGEVKFQNSSGVRTEQFLELLQFYLNSTAILFDNDFYVQKKGICIGSSVAPALSDIFLSSLDRRVAVEISDLPVVKIYRYVDDYLVFLNAAGTNDVNKEIETVLSKFTALSKGMTFTLEKPQGTLIQFLDLELDFTPDHVCYMYKPRTKKSLLPFISAHSKLVKRGIATNCLQAALVKSCQHKAEESFRNQTVRLNDAGFPVAFVINVCETLLQKVKGKDKRTKTHEERKKTYVIPYLHRISHNVKKVAARYQVNVLFSAPCKLSKICPMLEKKESRGVCKKKHVTRFTDCVSNVVYEVPLNCGHVYIGQTGRCFNERAREHRLAVRSNSGGHMSEHCKRCGCQPLLEETRFLRRAVDKTEREIIEAYYIKKANDKCISTPSLSLFDKEFQFLDGFL